MEELPHYVLVIKELGRTRSLSSINPTPQNPKKHYSLLIQCEDKHAEETTKTRLRPYLPPEFEFDQPHFENERGTQWVLFAGCAGKEEEESIKSWMVKQLMLRGDYHDASNINIDNQFSEWRELNQYTFHLIVYCNPRMREMITLIEAGDLGSLDEKLLPDQPRDFNAAGLPCLYIAAQMGQLAIVERRLSLEPELLNEEFGPTSQTILHCAMQGNHTGHYHSLATESIEA
ncbi:MAG: hypothetical protein Q9179_007819 [Wetmoreana sp. 5 TL-2023]